jgi:formylmethanofuran dehydrogenase subunit E
MQTLTNSFICPVCGERWPNNFKVKYRDCPVCQGCYDDLEIKAKELIEN